MAYNVVWEPRGVVIYFSGHISIHDILKATVDYEQDSRFDHLLYVIDDYTQIQSCSARPREIEEVWAMDYGAKHSNRNIRKAVVTTSAEVVKLALYYKNNLVPAFLIEIYATQDDARAWLKV